MIKNKKILYLELLFSLLIIIFTFVIITFLCLKMNEKIEIIIKNNEASNISTNIFENINSRTYNNISEYIQEFSGVGVTKKLDLDNQNIVIDGNLFNDTFFGTKIPNGYILEFNSENPSEDFVTLITCTPYMINSHRLLVRGKRAEEENMEEKAVEAMAKNDKTEKEVNTSSTPNTNGDINSENQQAKYIQTKQLKKMIISIIIFILILIIGIMWVLKNNKTL